MNRKINTIRDLVLVEKELGSANAGVISVSLKKEGFEQVYNLSGGVTAWQADNLPLTKK